MKHLYEFESSGYFAAESREEALVLVAASIGDRETAEEDFERDVPDDEVIEASSEESWEHPTETVTTVKGCTGTETWEYPLYHVKLTAAEHAARAPEWGYCFGGEE